MAEHKLPLEYVCRKCNKTYSNLEYEESRFCKACGSFLLRNFRDDRYAEMLAQKSFRNQASTTVANSSFKEKIALTRAAESLSERIGRSKEYEVISETEKNMERPAESVVESWIWSSEYDEALKLEQELIKQYEGKNLQNSIAGEVVSNQQGECYQISASCISTFKKATYQESRQQIISDLKALPGIGPAREQTLKQQGYMTIEDLENHPLWKKQAHDFMKVIDKKEIPLIQNWLWQRFPKSHPLLHYLAGFCQDQDFAIVDIETLGLSERPIILLGVATPTKTHVCTSQFLLRDIQDEPGAIWALVSRLEPNLSLVTYNGRSFDIPYIRQRLAYYGLDAPLDNPHFDVLHFTRRALRHKLSDCKLETVEKYIGIKRDINIPGALVPHFYETYLRTKNAGPLVAIVEHNRQDLLTLGTLFSKLYEEWNL
ncbi:MAG: ribonuclease H-like domain-containing protein [Candidatus Bathyarchaeia archaeon]